MYLPGIAVKGETPGVAETRLLTGRKRMGRFTKSTPSNPCQKTSQIHIADSVKRSAKRPKMHTNLPISDKYCDLGGYFDHILLEKDLPKALFGTIGSPIGFWISEGPGCGRRSCQIGQNGPKTAPGSPNSLKMRIWISERPWRSLKACLNAVLDLRTDLEILENARGGCSVMEWRRLARIKLGFIA